MNDLVKFGGGGLPANPEDLISGLQHVSAGLSGRSGGTPYLRLLKTGVFAYGQEDIEPQQGSRWAVNPHSFQHGFACWGDGELLGEAMVPLNQPPPDINDLQDFGAGWDQQIAMQLQCLNGEDTGVTVLYKGTAVGFLNMAKQLIDQMVLQLQNDPKSYVPVVYLDMGHYQHKKYGKTFFPVLDVEEWISIDGAATADTGKLDQPDVTPEKTEDPAPREPADKPKGRARRGAVEQESSGKSTGGARRGAVEPETSGQSPSGTNNTETDAVVNEMEGDGEYTSVIIPDKEAPPTRSRRRRAG